MLKKDYDDKVAQKEELGNKAKMLQEKLERAGKIVSGLGGEKERWEASVEVRDDEKALLLFLSSLLYSCNQNLMHIKY